MMLDMSMSAGMSQEMDMRVTPALLNLAHLLTLPTMALHQMVEQELTENPALEEIEIEELPADQQQDSFDNDFQFDETYDYLPRTGVAGRTEDEVDSLLFVAAPRSLSEGLIEDLYATLPESEQPIAQALIGSLDDQGFLADDLEDLAQTIGVSLERFTAVLQHLRELGPIGIATRDTRECMLAQLLALEAQGITCPHAYTIVSEYMEDLGAHRYTRIARQFQITTDDVRAVREFIQHHLWPYPAQAALSTGSEPNRVRYRRPDLSITKVDGEFTVEVLNSPRRMLRLNPLYQELARQAATLEEGEREHVQEFVARARTFLANLRQRESTLQRIGEAIVARQEEFLHHGVRHLAPMTRTEIAAELGLHESTVSRATSDKAALLPDMQLLPLSEFFVAARGVQDVLRELIENEHAPLSDAELARLLGEQGYSIARRTVAKYREQMQIPPSNLR